MVFHKYPKIKIVGDEENKDIFRDKKDIIFIEEKVDGANFRFMINNGRIIFGSRTQSIGDSNQDIGGNWKRCVEFIKDKLSNLSESKLHHYQSYIFYGECMVKHSIDYDWDKVPPFLGFDIFDIEYNTFLDYELKESTFKGAKLEIVPLIKECPACDIKDITDKDIPKSSFYDGQCEGLVFKNYKKQIMAKYVTKKFKEVNRNAFGGGKKFADNDDERIVAMFCTNPRIDKVIFKLHHEGEPLDIKMMHKLPRYVINDIYEEHWKDICFSKWSVNFRNIQKLVSKRCFEVLNQIITNNALQEK